MYFSGFYTEYVVKITGYSLIPVFAAIFVGNKINHKIDQKTFLKLVYVLLIVSGGTLLFTAFTQ